ncbi:hypothetical protein E2P81_ATG00829 [Venturia nashicola]|uniref:Uncharacterized protein n=1 Tax=Venturia nashicola TaxID=86259 RepID=A0A4Z1PCS7_9PEZI|nr:hypothetical protein E6O75_ATG00846 [Venturia nashicola]TLD38286.1 hypothetical protein E2P81_ATG00829 [Venturia nashicola]
MKISTALSLLACITSISATTHDFCCCSKKGQGCLKDETEKVRQKHKGNDLWHTSLFKWSQSDKAPFNCEKCYVFAATGDFKIGGEQMSNECDKYGVGSSCWDARPVHPFAKGFMNGYPGCRGGPGGPPWEGPVVPPPPYRDYPPVDRPMHNPYYPPP